MKLWEGLHVVTLRDCFKLLVIICPQTKGKEEIINSMNTK